MKKRRRVLYVFKKDEVNTQIDNNNRKKRRKNWNIFNVSTKSTYEHIWIHPETEIDREIQLQFHSNMYAHSFNITCVPTYEYEYEYERNDMNFEKYLEIVCICSYH